MQNMIRLSLACLLVLISALGLRAQDNVPQSAKDFVFPDADAKMLFESLKGHEVRSLNGLQKIYVVSDKITRDLITQGFKIDEMIKAVEVSLRNAGIKTPDYNEFKTLGKEGYPFLKIKVEISQDQNKNSYNGLVKVALTQRVVMARYTSTTATTAQRPIWTSQYFPTWRIYMLKRGIPKKL